MRDLGFPSTDILLVLATAACVGSLVQACVGFGLGVLAAPVVTLLEPRLMPESLLVAGSLLPLLILAAEWRHADIRGVGWILLGRLPGALAGVWILAMLSTRQLMAVVGVVVIGCVLLTMSKIELQPSRQALLLAGAASGVTGTAFAMGGPMVGVVYQHRSGHQIRATIAAFSSVGSAASLVMLGLAGQVNRAGIGLGLALGPAVALGFLAAMPLRGRLRGGRMRAAVLTCAALAGVGLILRAALPAAA